MEALDGLGQPEAPLLAAARADMEFETSLPALRHYLENRLAAFAHAVASQDCQSLAEVVRGVAVRMEGCPVCTGSIVGARQIVSWFGVGPSSWQTVHNLSVHFEPDSVVYSAIYQDWDVSSQPRCTAIGTYRGRLKAEIQVWKWVEHTVHRPWAHSHDCLPLLSLQPTPRRRLPLN